MIEEIQNLNLKVAQLTSAFNSLVSNSKDIDSLPEQTTFSETSKLHVSNNGISEKLEVSKILSAFDGGLENWEAKVYTNYISVVKDNSIYILNSNVTLPYNSTDFDAELSNDIWVKLYSENPTVLTTDTNLDDLLTPEEYIFGDGVQISFNNSTNVTEYLSSNTYINIISGDINNSFADLIRVIVEKHKQAPDTDEFDVYTQTVIYGNTQEKTRVFKRVFTSELLGNTDFVELTNNLSQGSLSITEVTTFAEITNGGAGLYYLTVEDNTDPNDVKEIGEYVKLSDESIFPIKPNMAQIDTTKPDYVKNKNRVVQVLVSRNLQPSDNDAILLVKANVSLTLTNTLQDDFSCNIKTKGFACSVLDGTETTYAPNGIDISADGSGLIFRDGNEFYLDF